MNKFLVGKWGNVSDSIIAVGVLINPRGISYPISRLIWVVDGLRNFLFLRAIHRKPEKNGLQAESMGQTTRLPVVIKITYRPEIVSVDLKKY